MYRSFHDRFGTAGVVIGVIALIVAIGGSAIAASGLNGKQKKQVKAIAKSFAGKPGAPGAAGTPGTNGTNGKDGPPGTPGTAGKSVVVGSFTGEDEENEEPAGEPCELNGGSEVEVEGSGQVDYNCNGAEGSPWTLGGKLPPGATLTGTFGPSVTEGSFRGAMGPGAKYLAPISFQIPLVIAPQFIFVQNQNEGLETGSAPGCPGIVNGLPKADPGKFCVYMARAPFAGASITSFTLLNEPVTDTAGASRTGALLEVACGSEAPCWAAGVWAVTG